MLGCQTAGEQWLHQRKSQGGLGEVRVECCKGALKGKDVLNGFLMGFLAHPEGFFFIFLMAVQLLPVAPPIAHVSGSRPRELKG